MVGAEIVVGYMFAWMVRKTKRAADRADEQVDEAIDVGMDRLGERLHELVAGTLRDDSALERLTAEAQQGLRAPSPRTAQRVALALEDATEDDPDFAKAIEDLVKHLQAMKSTTTTSTGSDSVAIFGNASARASDGGIAINAARDVTIGNPRMPGVGNA